MDLSLQGAQLFQLSIVEGGLSGGEYAELDDIGPLGVTLPQGMALVELASSIADTIAIVGGRGEFDGGRGVEGNVEVTARGVTVREIDHGDAGEGHLQVGGKVGASMRDPLLCLKDGALGADSNAEGSEAGHLVDPLFDPGDDELALSAHRAREALGVLNPGLCARLEVIRTEFRVLRVLVVARDELLAEAESARGDDHAGVRESAERLQWHKGVGVGVLRHPSLKEDREVQGRNLQVVVCGGLAVVDLIGLLSLLLGRLGEVVKEVHALAILLLLLLLLLLLALALLSTMSELDARSEHAALKSAAIDFGERGAQVFRRRRVELDHEEVLGGLHDALDGTLGSNLMDMCAHLLDDGAEGEVPDAHGLALLKLRQEHLGHRANRHRPLKK